MTREANVWLNGSEVNTQQMEDFFFLSFPPFQEIWSSPLAGYMRLGGPRGISPIMPFEGAHLPPAAAGPQGVSGCVHSLHRVSPRGRASPGWLNLGRRTVYAAR